MSIVWLKRGVAPHDASQVIHVAHRPGEEPLEACRRHISERPQDRNAALAVLHEVEL